MLERLQAWGLTDEGWKKPLVVALILRAVATVSGVGYLFADDYSSVMEPAAAWLDDPTAPFPWSIRSELFPRMFSFCLAMAQAIGLEDPARMLQWAYGLLGLWSLLAVVGTYKLTEKFFDARAATLAAWLMAAYPLMPRISTRALIEVACLPPLVWGLFFLVAAQRRERKAAFGWAVLGGALLAVAAMFRFQVGLIYVGVFPALVWQAYRGKGSWEPVAGMFVGGLVGGGLQALLDTVTYGWPFASLYTYVKFNVENATELYGATGGFYTYFLFYVLLALPPAAIAFAKPFWRAARSAPTVALGLAVFVVVHSFVPHKEERFMFSGLPLFFCLLAPAILWSWHEGGVWSRRAVGFFATVTLIALPAVTLSDSQQSGTAPLLEIARSEDPPDTVYWVALREPPTYYAGGRARLVWTEQIPRNDPRRFVLRRSLQDDTGTRARFVFALPPSVESNAAIAEAGYRCHSAKQFPGDFIDDLVYRVNPKRNLRRAPTQVYDCERTRS